MILFSSLNGLNSFLFMLFVGIVLGIFYEVCLFLRKVFVLKIFKVVFDVAFVFISFIVVLFAINYCAYGCIRAYLFLGLLLGFFTERVSIGFLVAKSLKFIYNYFVNKLKKFKGRHRGRRKVKKNC